MPERNPSSGERAKAVLQTLRSNRNAQVDGLLGTVGAITPSFLMSDSFARIILGANVGLIGIILRKAVDQHLEEGRKIEAIEEDLGNYPVGDERTILGFLRDAWRTGKSQMPVASEGRVDSADALQHYHRH